MPWERLCNYRFQQSRTLARSDTMFSGTDTHSRSQLCASTRSSSFFQPGCSRRLIFSVPGVVELCMHVYEGLFATGHVSSSHIFAFSFVRGYAVDMSEGTGCAMERYVRCRSFVRSHRQCSAVVSNISSVACRRVVPCPPTLRGLVRVTSHHSTSSGRPLTMPDTKIVERLGEGYVEDRGGEPECATGNPAM
jgi:hypothetical protein